MEGLGKDFNFIHTASGLKISLKDASGVTFICEENAGDQVATFTQHSGATESNLTTRNYYYNTAVSGAAAWTRVEIQSPTHQITKGNGAGNRVAAYYVDASQLTDGYDTVECTVDAGTCQAIVHGLLMQRNPANLPVPLTA